MLSRFENRKTDSKVTRKLGPELRGSIKFSSVDLELVWLEDKAEAITKCSSSEVINIAPAHYSKTRTHHIAHPTRKTERHPTMHLEREGCWQQEPYQWLPKAQDKICINTLPQRCKHLRVQHGKKTEKAIRCKRTKKAGVMGGQEEGDRVKEEASYQCRSF